MTWNHDMSTAPLGKTVKTERKGKDDKVITTEVFVPDHIWLASKCGKVGRSYWIENEQRWSGYAKDEQPVAWQPYVIPAHPGLASDEVQHDDELDSCVIDRCISCLLGGLDDGLCGRSQ